MDWVWWWNLIQNLVKFIAFVVAANFLRTSLNRIIENAAKLEAKEERRPIKNRRKVLCNKSTQWRQEDFSQVGKVPSLVTKRESENLNKKIELFKKNFNQPFIHIDKHPNNLLTNGLVSDMKSKFEERPATKYNNQQKQQQYFQKTVSNVKALNNFYNQTNKRKSSPIPIVISKSQSTVSLSPEPPIVVLRRKRQQPQFKLDASEEDVNFKANNFKYVRNLEEILRQQRFSRSLSQYSVSDLCVDESQSEISQDCQKFDEWFAKTRSSENLLDSPIGTPSSIPRSRSSSSISRFSFSTPSEDLDDLINRSNPAISKRLNDYRLSKSASEYSLNELIRILDTESFV